MLVKDFVVEDPRFERLVLGNVAVEKLYTGSRWAEGPAYFAAGKYLLWSDIPNNRLLRFDETDNSVSVFQQPSNHQNGHTVDAQGRLISCEHLGRCVSMIDHDGTRVVLADHFNGKKLNSPNDVVVKRDGSIWFTDPSYGIDTDYEGDHAPSEQDGCYVYRIDPDGTLAAVATDFVRPNGLAFSPDESVLYISDTGVSPSHIRAFSVDEDGKMLGHSQVFATCEIGGFDGFRVDQHGNVWTSAGDGVHCYAPDGTRLGRILIPEVVANVEFGGPKRNRLFIAATTSLYAVYLNTKPVHP